MFSVILFVKVEVDTTKKWIISCWLIYREMLLGMTIASILKASWNAALYVLGD